MSKLLVKLIKIANNLDAAGLYEQANTVDLIIKAESERPRAVENFIQALKKAFENVASSSVAPSINKNSLPDIINVINILAEHGNFINPSVGPETLSKLTDEVYVVADNLIELSKSINDIKNTLNTDLSSDKKQQLQHELLNDQKKLNEYMSMVDSWKLGRRKDDVEKYTRLQEVLKKRKEK